MRSEKTMTPSQREEKKKKRLRFAGLVILTILVVAVTVATVFIAQSCNATVDLDIGQPYDAGRATVTVANVEVKRAGVLEQVYAIITLKVQAEKDFTLDPNDFELDGVSPMKLGTSDGTYIDTAETEISAGTTEQVKIAFMVPRSMKVSFLTYKKAVIRIGSMIENIE